MRLGADIVELHTGTYCHAHHDGDNAAFDTELERLAAGAALADELGLEVHAGHGLCFETVKPIAAIPQVMELNIGHFLIGEAIFVGLGEAIAEMSRLMDEARGRRGFMILGIGNDIIDIRRIEQSLERFGDRFVQRLFTETEQKRSERRNCAPLLMPNGLPPKKHVPKRSARVCDKRCFLARYGGRQSGLRQADHEIDQWRAGAIG